MTALGHVVFYVRNLKQSVAPYRDIVGLQVISRILKGRSHLPRHLCISLYMLTGNGAHHEPLSTKHWPHIDLYHGDQKIREGVEIKLSSLLMTPRKQEKLKARLREPVKPLRLQREPHGSPGENRGS